MAAWRNPLPRPLSPPGRGVTLAPGAAPVARHRGTACASLSRGRGDGGEGGAA